MKVVINAIIATLISAAILFGINAMIPNKIVAWKLQDIYNNVDFDHAKVVKDLAKNSPRILLTVKNTGNDNFIIKQIEVARNSKINLKAVKNMFE